jgi:hypothetical protein
MLRDRARFGCTVLVTLFISLPALAGNIYSWRTEDGGYAYTDDAKAIPARYRDQVSTRPTDGLKNYRRITAAENGSSDDYGRRLSNRLASLRALNQDLDRASARNAYRDESVQIQVNAGAIDVGVPTSPADEGPIVIETVRFRYRDEMATRHNTVVRNGDRVLTIIKGKPLVGAINQAPDLSEMVDY